MDGEFIEYDEEGNLTKKGNYIGNIKDGLWEYYWDNGQLSTKRNYKDTI